MPYPQNLETAQSLEKIITKYGAIPARIAIISGKIKVGLDADEMESLAKTGPKAIKTSRRDIPFVLSNKIMCATTVSGTMYAANLCGIKVFVTGGIGGVHRGAETSFDISAGNNIHF